MKAAFKNTIGLFALTASSVFAFAQDNGKKTVKHDKMRPVENPDCVERVVYADYVEGNDTIIHYRDYDFCDNSVAEVSARYGKGEAISGMSLMPMDAFKNEEDGAMELQKAKAAYELRMK